MVYRAVDSDGIDITEHLSGRFCGRYGIDVPGNRVVNFNLGQLSENVLALGVLCLCHVNNFPRALIAHFVSCKNTMKVVDVMRPGFEVQNECEVNDLLVDKSHRKQASVFKTDADDSTHFSNCLSKAILKA